MNLDFLKVREVQIKGNVSIKTEELQVSINQNLSGKYLYLLPRDNILIFPKNEIEKKLSKQFSRIDTLNISTSHNNLEITMTERKPNTLWCGQSFAQTVDPCSFVDSQGFVFAAAPQFDGSSYIKFYGATPTTQEASTTGDILPDGNQPAAAWQFIPEKEYSDIQNFITGSKNLGVELTAVELSDARRYRFQIKNNGLLIANRNIDLAGTLENLKASLSNQVFWTVKTDGKNKVEQKKLNQLEYIDVRYGNKVFYKLYAE